MLGRNCKTYVNFKLGTFICNVLCTSYFLNIGYGRSLCVSSSKIIGKLNETRFIKRPRFGIRYLREPALVYKFNCWYEDCISKTKL